MKIDKLVEVFKALGDQTRLSILMELAGQTALSSGDIAKKYQTSWATISRHLNVLRKAKLIKLKRESQHVFYSVNEKFLMKVMKNLTEGFKIDTVLLLEKLNKPDDNTEE